MNHSLVLCKYTEYMHDGIMHKFGLEIFPIRTRHTFRISVYSDSKITLSDDKILDMLCSTFSSIRDLKDNIALSMSVEYGRTRNSIEVNVNLSLYEKISDIYDTMPIIWVYGDKIFKNTKFLNYIKIKSLTELETAMGILPYNKNNIHVNLFFNNMLVSVYSDPFLLWTSLSREHNVLGIYLND